jgi:hypothetical protein
LTTATPMLERLVAEKYSAELAASRPSFPTAKYASDPVAFCTEILGFAPTGKQVAILEGVRDHDRVAIPSGRKTGKSRILAALALWWFSQHDDATVVLVAPSERQIVEVVWYDLVGLYQQSGRCLQCVTRDPDGARPCRHSTAMDGALSASVRTGLRSMQRRIIGLAPRNADNARGVSGPHQLWALDESSGIPRGIYEAADGNRAAGAKLVCAGQPTSRATWFFDACERLGFHVIPISSRDSPNVKLGRKVVPGLADAPWIEEKRLDWGGEDDPRFQVEVLGLFPTREAARLVSDLELAQCFERHEAADLETLSGPLYFGIDPAGGRGGDKSAIVARRGSAVVAMMAFNGATDQIMGELDVLVRKLRRGLETYVVNFDGSSTFGADLSVAMRQRQGRDDRLEWHALDMRGDPKNSPVLRESRCCRNIDAFYLNLSVRLRSDAAIPFDSTLRDELLFAEFREDLEDGGSKLISKRSFRKQLGRSPDLSDALAFAFWEGRVAPASHAAAEYRAAQAAPEPAGETAPPAYDLYGPRAAERAFDPWSGANFQGEGRRR